MLFWIVVVCILFFLLIPREYSGKRVFSILSAAGCIFLILLSVFRFDIGWDYHNYFTLEVPDRGSWYELLFEGFDSIDTEYHRYKTFEPLSRLLYQIAIAFGWKPLIFVLFGGLTYILILKTCRDYSQSFASAFFAYLALFYCDSLSIIRQALAVAVIFYSYRYFSKKKLLPFLLCVVVSAMFHKAAWCALIIYPVYWWCSNKQVYYGIGIGLILSHILSDLLFSFFPKYKDEYASLPGGTIMIYFNLCLYILLYLFVLYLYREEKEQTDQTGETIIDMRLFKIVFLSLLFPFVLGLHLGIRVGSFYSIFVILLFGAVPAFRKLSKPVAVSLMSCGFALFFLFFLHYTGRGRIDAPYFPYRCILFTNTAVMKDYSQ